LSNHAWAIRRWEGVMFLSFFAIYLANLVLEETDASERGCLVHCAAGDRDGRGLSLAGIPKAHDGDPEGIRESDNRN
jgi:hypothetical protein